MQGLGIAVAALAAFAGDARCQDAPRARLLGRVVRDDGRIWTDAEVHLFSHPMPGTRCGEPDHVKTSSDDRGRFKVELLAGRTYSAWAIGTGRPDRWRATRVAENVQAGTPVKLVQDPVPRLPSRIHLRRQAGVDGEFSLRVRCATQSYYSFELTVDRNSEVLLPTLPGRHAWIEVLDPQGRVFSVYKFRLTAELLPEGAGPKPAAGGGSFLDALSRALERQSSKEIAAQKVRPRSIPIIVRKPMELPFRVLHAESKRPIAGARVLGLATYRLSDELFAFEGPSRSEWVPLGTTGPDGKCRVAVPDSVLIGGEMMFWGSTTFAVAAPGCATVTKGVEDLRPSRGLSSKIARAMIEQKKRDPDQPVKLTLPAGAFLNGKLLTDEATPAARRTMLVQSATPEQDEGAFFGPDSTLFRQHVVTDENGTFQIPGLGIGKRFIVKTAADADLRTAAGITGLPLPAGTAIVLAGTAKREVAPRRVQLAQLRSVYLTVAAADGSPVRDARVTLVPEWGDTNWGSVVTDIPVHARTDPRGRVRFIAPPGRYDVLVVDERRSEFAMLTAVPAGSDTPHELALRAMAVLAGRVADRNGKPVPGAEVDRGASTTTNASLLTELADQVNERLMTTMSGTDGTFEMRFIPLPKVEFEVRASYDVPGREESVDVEVDVGRTKGERDLHLELDFELPKGKG